MNSIDSSRLLAEMQRMAQAADSGSSIKNVDIAGKPASGDFSDLFSQALGTVNELQMQAGELSDRLVKGDPGVTLAQSVLAGQKASIAFEATLQVRNRLVQAYQDIMNMPL
ncbi:MAG TPA: flagellar hook-basal body complex protein FliE [Aeromonadales bacterium]|nr:flagellar hook-basal body complex protein FliE [Aeromonadales bacterium]